jgi:glycosyltransferase involved in cell wall biosynthesis
MTNIHIVSSLDLNYGGPSKSVSDLAFNQSILAQKVSIFTIVSDNPYFKDSPHPNLSLRFVRKKNFKKDLICYINDIKFDILHGHGIWQMPVHHMAQLARKKNIPYIITPRGMLEPWALNAGKWKKKLALAFYQRKDLAKAACIHATAQMEADSIRKLGFKNPVAVIPNGIDISEFPVLTEKPKKENNTLLFLSRIHPKKGIENLIEAWKQLNKSLRQNWQIEIAGNGDKIYITTLQKLIDKKGLSEEIKIIGPQFGEAKLATYSRADLFVLPTYSENFGVVIAEALACGVPVITTNGTPWHELNSHHAGWCINIGDQPLVEALQEALQLPIEKRRVMGQNGRKLVEEKYSIEAVASQMIQLYKWILKEGDKPEFVYEQS